MFKSSSYILSGPEDDLRILKGSIGKYLFDCLKRRAPADTVYINVATGEVLTCEQLLTNSIKVAAVLRQLGIKKDDVIVIASENTIHYCEVVLAGLYSGIIVNPLNPVYGLDEFKHALSITRPKLVISSELALNTFLKLQKDLNFKETLLLMGTLPRNYRNGENVHVKRVEDLISTTTVDAESFQPDSSFDCSEQGAFILLSSGTTGLPKGVLITHQNVRESLGYLSHPLYGNATSADSTVLVLPFFHVFGLLIQIVAITTSMKLALMTQFKPDTFLQALQDYKVTKFYAVPPLLLFLAKSPLVHKYDLSSVKDILVGGAAVSEQLQQDTIERFKSVTVRHIYGLTESSGATTMQTFDMDPHANAGRLVHNATAKICDPDTNENLGPLKTGELCFNGPMIMKGYYGNVSATQDCIDQDGYFHTGDLGFYDEYEQIHIVGRLKELIKYKGFQVPPAELEALILNHPGVGDCAVIGIPDDRAGELPLAYVVRENGANCSEQEIVDYVAENISVQKRLYGGVVFTEEIPKTPSGKILRRKLVESYMATS